MRRVYQQDRPAGETRVLVDRLWPRGIRKDDVDQWHKEVAPTDGLRRWFGHESSRFDEFARRYRCELDANEATDGFVLLCARLLEAQDVALLFAARDCEHNNAVVLAGYVQGRLDKHL